MGFLLLGMVMIVIPILIIGYYSLLKKANFDFKGFELILYEIAVIFSGIFIGSISEVAFFVLFMVLMAIAIYYFIRMINKKEYINIWIVICYIILSIVNTIVAAIVCNNTHIGWCMCGIMYLLIAFVVPIYIVILNGITFIIRKIKKIEDKETRKINKKLIILLFIMVILFVCLGTVVVK